MTTEEVLELLQEVTETSDGWKARCPAHFDQNPSLSIARGREGKTLLKCWSAQCSFDDIVDALGLKKGDLSAVETRKSEPDEEYVYQDEHGEPLTMVRRYGDKRFVQLHWEAEDGKWLSGAKGARRVPYHLPELLAGIAEGHTIQIVEGEKDVDRLRAHRMEATCNAGGAGKGEWSEWAEQGLFNGAHVALIPDNDDIGRKHVTLVAKALFGHAADIRIVTLPVAVKGDASDYLNDHNVDDFIELVHAAPLLMEPPEAEVVTDTSTNAGSSINVIRESGTAPYYARSTKDDEYLTVSDFVFTPLSTITVKEDPPRTIFVVEVRGEEHQLPSETFNNVQRFHSWCGSRNLSWSGAARDLEGVLFLLRSADVPEREGTTIVGLHGHSFVLPEETIGGDGDELIYVPHEFGNEWAGSTLLDSVEESLTTSLWTEHIYDLATMHLSLVMTPILGWVAAAPLRSRCSQFPILAVAGSSGWGKTTIIQTVLKAFGFWMDEPQDLPGFTPHAVVGSVTTNNGLPQWFDEYRYSIRSDTMDMVDNALRHAWNGGSIRKGGTVRDNVMLVRGFPVDAPIIVTGEESFTEISHSERMISIDLPKEGRNLDALESLVNGGGIADLHGIGRSYLEWLVSDEDEDVKQPPNVLANRPAQCESIARWGYMMLGTFLERRCGYSTLPKFNYTHARTIQTETANASPYEELIEAAMNATDRDGRQIAWIEDECIYVRLEALYAWNRTSRTDIRLPSRKSRDLRVFLEQEYGAMEDKNHVNGRAWLYRDPGT